MHTQPAGTLGIDFGTSNSAMAWAPPHGLAQPLALEGQAVAMPTAVFFNTEDQRTHFGRVEASDQILAARREWQDHSAAVDAARQPQPQQEALL